MFAGSYGVIGGTRALQWVLFFHVPNGNIVQFTRCRGCMRAIRATCR